MISFWSSTVRRAPLPVFATRPPMASRISAGHDGIDFIFPVVLVGVDVGIHILGVVECPVRVFGADPDRDRNNVRAEAACSAQVDRGVPGVGDQTSPDRRTLVVP